MSAPGLGAEAPVGAQGRAPRRRGAVLALVGDLMPGRGVSVALPRLTPELVWGDVLPLLRSADAVLGNLECPITGHDRRWHQTWKAFHFRAEPAVVGLLRAANVKGLALANNHILDYGEEGLAETIAHLRAAGIAHAGAGLDSEAAMRPALIDLPGVRVGLLSFTDTMAEFAAAPGRAGTNHVRIRADHATLALVGLVVRALREGGAECVVASVHWGPNLRTQPTAAYRSFARELVRLGVDIVHGHSAHLVQGVERFRGGLILYDTGDLLDDYWVFPGIRTDRSFVFVVDLEGGRPQRLRMHPVSLSPARVRLARGREFEAIRRTMLRRCRPFGTSLASTPSGLELIASAPSTGTAEDRPLPWAPLVEVAHGC
jgi:poly-gamma-glutamate synthesis protein (capsule biosynthesis protein)